MQDTQETCIRGLTKRWRINSTDDTHDADHLAATLNVPPLIGRLLWNRDIRDVETASHFLDPKLTDLHDPAGLPGAERAAERIAQAIREKQTIAIYGDYDVDGVTATTIMFLLLRAIDPTAKVLRYIPHRLEEGYGLNGDAIRTLADSGANLIVSVDCGITAVEQAKIAREIGVDLIITDHHELANELPDAYALVHPRLPDTELDKPSAYPWGELCGAGVAYKLCWQIARTWCGSDRLPDVLREMMVELLTFAALGTVADVVPLLDENRIITHFGLRRMKNTSFTGLNALIDAASLRGETIDSYGIGFKLGPRLNACGRMGHAKRAVRLLTDAPYEEANEIARFLNTENDKRRATERSIIEEAKQLVEDHGYDQDDTRAIVLANQGWHAGVIGIVCSRLVETYGRPTILLNIDDEGIEAHGSGRSIDGFNLHEALTACGEYMTTFGGHAMAAGMRLKLDNLEAFREALIAYANDRLTPDDLTPMITLEATASLDELDTRFVSELERMAPFGRCNERPTILVPDIKLARPAVTMGREAKHLSMHVRQGGMEVRCVGWSMGHLTKQLPGGQKIDLACKPKLNEWRGVTSVDLEIVDIRLADAD